MRLSDKHKATAIEICEILTLVERAKKGDSFATWKETRMLLEDPGCDLSWHEGDAIDRAARMLVALRTMRAKKATRRAR